MTWEGRLQSCLSPRRTHAFKKGWNDEDVVTSVEEWEESVLEDVAKGWYREGTTADGQLKTESDWLQNELHPWAQQAQKELENWRRWKAGALSASLPPVESIGTSVPEISAKCLSFITHRNTFSNLYILSFTSLPNECNPIAFIWWLFWNPIQKQPHN